MTLEGSQTVGRQNSRQSQMSSTLASGSARASSLFSRAYNTLGGAGSSAARSASSTTRQSLRNLKTTSKESGTDLTQQGTRTTMLKGFDGVIKAPHPSATPFPAPKLSPEQKHKYNELLEHFRSQKDFPTSLKAENAAKRAPASDWEKMRNLTREGLLRYLRATKWDVNAAKKRLTETIAWRREFGVDDIDADLVEPEAKSGKETVQGFDNHARPLHYMHPHRNDTKETPRQMQFAVWILERCIDVMPPGVEQLALLINFEHRSRNPTSLSNAKLMLYILQNHYVERLGVALCINVPWIFKAFWNAIQPFIDPVTKGKCKFDEAIKDEVPGTQLSADFGGELDPEYEHDKYWPELVQDCKRRRDEMLQRFLTHCSGEIGASEWVIRGGDADADPVDVEAVGTVKGAAAEATRDDDAAPPVATPAAANDGSTPLERFMTPSETLAGAAALAPIETREAAKKRDESKEKEQTHKQSPLAHLAEVVGIKKHHDGHQNGSAAPNGNAASASAAGTSDTQSEVASFSEKHGDPGAINALAAGVSGVALGGAAAAGAATRTPAGSKPSSIRSAALSNGAGTPGRSANVKPISMLYFAAAKDAVGRSNDEIRLPTTPLPLKDFPAVLLKHVEAAARAGMDEADPERLKKIMENSRWSVDREMVDEDDETILLRGGEELAIIPPVSGG